MLTHRLRRACWTEPFTTLIKDSGVSTHTTGSPFTWLNLSGKNWADGDFCWAVFGSDDEYLFETHTGFTSRSTTDFASGGANLISRTLQTGDTTFDITLEANAGDGMQVVWVIIDSAALNVYFTDGQGTPGSGTLTPHSMGSGVFSSAWTMEMVYFLLTEDTTGVCTTYPDSTLLENNRHVESIYSTTAAIVSDGPRTPEGSGNVSPTGDNWAWSETATSPDGGCYGVTLGIRVS